MRWGGKIVGFLIGLMLGHPIWLILGVIVGHLYDIGFFTRWIQRQFLQQKGASTQRVFFDCTFSVMGYLAKADGRVSESEIRVAENLMQQMNLGPELRQEAIRLFNLGKQPTFNLSQTIAGLKSACWQHPILLQTFLEMQMQIANAEGHITSGKRTALENIYAELGLGFGFQQFEQQAYAEQNYQKYNQGPRINPEQHLQDSYQILNVSATASVEEIKKAYRRLMSQHHPDKLMAKGLPPEMIKLANEKTQKIKTAYETIRKSRGFQ
jgi:DnaJ like chaperone protein